MKDTTIQEDSATYPITEVQNLYKRINELVLWKEDALERIETLEKELLEESEHTKTLNNVLKVLTEALDSVSKEAKLAILDYRNEELLAKFYTLVEKETKKVNRKPRNRS